MSAACGHSCPKVITPGHKLSWVSSGSPAPPCTALAICTLQSQQVGRAQAGARTLEPCVFLRTLGELKEGRSWSPQTGVPRDPSSGRWTLTAIPASPGPRLALRLTGSPSSSWARPQAVGASLRATPAIHFPSPEARGCPGRRPLPNTNTIRACLFKQRPVMDV